MGQIANAIYVQLLNQDRRDEKLGPDPNGLRKLPKELPVKWALLQVLSKNCWISTSVLKVLLWELGYERSLSQIRRGLVRCVKFGLVERLHLGFKEETGVLKGKKPRRHTKWKLTERGRQLANTNPAQVLKGKVRDTYVHAQQANARQSSDRSAEDRVPLKQSKVLSA